MTQHLHWKVVTECQIVSWEVKLDVLWDLLDWMLGNKTGDSFFFFFLRIIILILQDFLRDFKVFLIYFHRFSVHSWYLRLKYESFKRKKAPNSRGPAELSLQRTNFIFQALTSSLLQKQSICSSLFSCINENDKYLSSLSKGTPRHSQTSI